MSSVFDTMGSISSIDASNRRKELIRLSIEGENESIILDNAYIMNFEATSACDYQLSRSISGDYLYTAFGYDAIPVTIHGFQALVADPSSGSATPAEDAETFYTYNCISAENPKVIKITTGSSGIVTNGAVYRGFMVSYTKKPFGESKANGYGFAITFICEKYPNPALLNKIKEEEEARPIFTFLNDLINDARIAANRLRNEVNDHVNRTAVEPTKKVAKEYANKLLNKIPKKYRDNFKNWTGRDINDIADSAVDIATDKVAKYLVYNNTSEFVAAVANLSEGVAQKIYNKLKFLE